MSEYTEQGTVFNCRDNRLLGIAAIPAKPAKTGLLIMVGGPQYRVGSHRQFTLLSRSLAEAGIPSFRFDYTGMGDSEGERRGFHELREDLSAALDRFQEMVPGLERVVLWGLCDAASGALVYVGKEPRVCSLVLLNPWVHSGDYSPEVKLSHYYGPLLKGSETWKRFFTGQIDVLPAAREFAGDSAVLLKKLASKSLGVPMRHPFVAEMLQGLEQFRGETLFVLSEQDLTAREFLSLTSNDKRWKKAMGGQGITMHEVAGADHTFSKKPWQDEVTRLTIDWVHRAENSSTRTP